MFRRILPAALAPLTLKILLPVTAAYAIICMLLIGFQCQPPTPWILDPKTCSSHGTIYYATTALNIATDLLLAVWILPAIWALQMKQDLKLLVMTLFGSRAAVCAVDVGRFVLVRRALRSADQTCRQHALPHSPTQPLAKRRVEQTALILIPGTQLPWAILDQVIVHLSINHATLPRVHVFLSNLQTGLLVTQLTTAAPTATRSKGSKRSGDAGDADDAVPLSGTGTRDRSARWKPHGSLSRRKVLRMLNLDRSGGGDAAKEGSISESPLRLQPEQGIELSTTIYADCGGSTGSAGGKVDEEYNSREDWGRRAPGSGSVAVLHRSDAQQHRKGTAGPRDIAINVHRTVEMKMEVLESGSAGSSKRGALR